MRDPKTSEPGAPPPFARGRRFKSVVNFTFLLFGFLLFAYLIKRVGIETVWQELKTVSVVHLAPILFLQFVWMSFYGWGFWTLIGPNRPGLGATIRDFIISDSISVLVPLGGLAGEPYKFRELRTRMSMADALTALGKDRLVHLIAGYLSGAICLGFTYVYYGTELSASLMLLLKIFFFGLLLASLVLSVLHLKHFEIGRFKNRFYLGVSDFVIALSLKLTARGFGAVETFVLLKVLGVEGAGFQSTILIMSFLTLAGLVFFMVPQGLGVAEVSVFSAFTILGLPHETALAFSVLRRIRLLIWAVAGSIWGFAREVRRRRLARAD